MNAEQSQILYHPARIKYLGGGERAGKSYLSASYAFARYGVDVMTAPHKHEEFLYWLIGEDYSMCRGELEYIVGFLKEMNDFDERGSSLPKRDQSVVITKHGGRFETKTARDPRKLGVVAPRGILGCEAGVWTQETYLRAIGRLAEKRGWGLFSGSFESSYSYYAGVWMAAIDHPMPEEAAFSLPTWSNLAIFPGGRTDPEILRLEARFPKARFMERFGGVPSKPSGTVFHLFSTVDHVKPRTRNPEIPIQLWVDPGYIHPYAILAVQIVDGIVHVLDELFLFRHTHQQAIAATKAKPWFSQVERVVIDVASRKETTDGPSGETTWERLTSLPVRAEYHLVKDQISRVTDFLSLNRIIVDPQCRGLIAEMGGGPPHPDFPGMTPWKYNVNSDGSVNVDKPTDKWDDACKALAYGLIHNFGLVDRSTRLVDEMNYLFPRPQSAGPRPAPGTPRISDSDAWMRLLAKDHVARLKRIEQGPSKSFRLWQR